VKQLIKNFTILDCLYSEKAQNLMAKIEIRDKEGEESKQLTASEQLFCVRHP
jgi:hypothetical protein